MWTVKKIPDGRSKKIDQNPNAHPESKKLQRDTAGTLRRIQACEEKYNAHEKTQTI